MTGTFTTTIGWGEGELDIEVKYEYTPDSGECAIEEVSCESMTGKDGQMDQITHLLDNATMARLEREAMADAKDTLQARLEDEYDARREARENF